MSPQRPKRASRLAKKLWNGFLWLLVLAGFPLVIWAGFSLATETYGFWRYGIEKTARVIELDRSATVPKGGTTHHYLIEIDGRRFVHSFRMRLPVGKDVAVLSMPQDLHNLTLGNSESSAFEIFSYSIGGDVMAVAVIATYCLMIWAGPAALVAWIKLRRQILDG
jgi:hypothetical protein